MNFSGKFGGGGSSGGGRFGGSGGGGRGEGNAGSRLKPIDWSRERLATIQKVITAFGSLMWLMIVFRG